MLRSLFGDIIDWIIHSFLPYLGSSFLHTHFLCLTTLKKAHLRRLAPLSNTNGVFSIFFHQVHHDPLGGLQAPRSEKELFLGIIRQMIVILEISISFLQHVHLLLLNTLYSSLKVNLRLKKLLWSQLVFLWRLIRRLLDILLDHIHTITYALIIAIHF